MPVVKADFSTIESGFGVIPAGDYRCRITKIDFDGAARNPFHTFELTIDDSENTDQLGKKVWDRIYMNKRDGSENPISLGKIKQYAEAILGEDAANSDNINTDDFLDGFVIASIEVEPWTNEEKGTSGESNKVKRVVGDA